MEQRALSTRGRAQYGFESVGAGFAEGGGGGGGVLYSDQLEFTGSGSGSSVDDGAPLGHV
jgi:hypothetical protein